MIAWEMDARTRRFTRVSGRAEAVLGYPVERWRGVPGFWIGVLHPDDRERVAAAVWRAIELRRSCEIEYRAIASDGTVVRLRDRVRVIPDPDGRGLLLQGSIVDLTEPRLPAVPPVRPARGRRWRRSRYDVILPASPIVPVGPFAKPPVEDRPAQRQPASSGAPPADFAPVDEPLPFETLEGAPPAAPPILPTLVEAPEPIAGAFDPHRLISAIGEAVIASDAEHRVVYWSPAAESLLGWEAADAVGRVDSEVLRTTTDAGQSAEIIAGLLGRRPWSATVLVHSRRGESIPARITASALRSGDDTLAGYVAVITDLRDVRRAEARSSAFDAMSAVARLSRAIAEELSGGLAGIEAAIRQALSRSPSTDPARPQLDDALRGIDSASALAAQLLAVGRGLGIRRAPTDLRDVVKRAMPAIQLLAGAGIRVSAHHEAAQPASVDPTVASQILLNLVANGCAAMTEAGRLSIATLDVELSERRSAAMPGSPAAGHYVVLEVTDSRERLPSDVLERLFEPFSDVLRPAPPGMGLAAAHGLVVLSGGCIIADSPPDGGLRFRVYLPAAST